MSNPLRSLVAITLPLTPLHVPVSGYVLYPVVGTTGPQPAMRANGTEVERIVEVPVSALADGSGLKLERRERDGSTLEVPYFDLGGDKLWGATAMVVAELLAVLGVRVDRLLRS